MRFVTRSAVRFSGFTARSWLLTGTVGALLVLGNCAALSSLASGESEPEYGSDAEENLKRGDQALDSKNFPEAARFFEYVKTKYPFLEFAKVAELRLADTDFERERYIEARDRYHNFTRLHPTHPKADYAAYRAALTHYKDMPSEFFLLPPAIEKDQVEVRGALTAMNDFIRSYPKSELLQDAKTVADEVKRRLAEHELYVADFYARRERWPAVVGRLNNVAKNYGGIGFDERVSFGLYDAYKSLKDDGRAIDALRAYVAQYPDQPGAARAKTIIASAPAPVVPPAPDAPDAGK